MALIQRPAITRRLQRALGLTSVPDGVLAPEIVGVVIVEDLSRSLDAEEIRPCMAGADSVALAGERSHITISRRSASVEVVCTGVTFSSPVTSHFQLILPTALVTVVVPRGQFNDRTLPGRPSSDVGVGTLVAGVTGNRILELVVLANDPVHIPLNIRLGAPGDPSSQVSVQVDAFNQLVRGGFTWVESPPLG